MKSMKKLLAKNIFSRPLILTILVGLTISFTSLAQDYRETIITDPSISRRCDDLTQKRSKKIKHKQRISALIQRNVKLQKSAPSNKKKVKRNLEINFKRLKNEYRLTKNKVARIEEVLVRNGCPGIAL